MILHIATFDINLTSKKVTSIAKYVYFLAIYLSIFYVSITPVKQINYTSIASNKFISNVLKLGSITYATRMIRILTKNI